MLPLDLFRYNTRLKALTFAIGICVAFIVGSFAFANGMNNTVKTITEKFNSEGALVYEGEDLSSSLFTEASIAADRQFISVGICTANVNNTTATFFAVRDSNNLLHQNLVPLEGEMLSGKLNPVAGIQNISTNYGSVNLTVNKTFSSAVFPSYWHLIRWDDISKLRPELRDNVSFIMFATVDNSLVSSLRSQGFKVQKMTGVLDYFDAGANEVVTDLWLIIVPASFIVSVLVYSAIAMETKDRAREIAILKTMGANNMQIGRIFLFQAFVLSLLGAAVGIIIGIMVSYAISTTSSIVIENSLFFLRVTEYSMVVALGCALVAGILGSIVPVYRASHKSVREAMK